MPSIIITINTTLVNINENQSGNSIESIKYAGIALLNVGILLLSMPALNQNTDSDYVQV